LQYKQGRAIRPCLFLGYCKNYYRTFKDFVAGNCMHKLAKVRRLTVSDNAVPFLGFLFLLLLLGAFIYLPGINGPFVFDDATNLLYNSYIQVTELSFESLYSAAYSLQAGPLQRPLAMLTFSLNHYLSGGFSNSFPYKLTNITIHIANGLLVFLFLKLILARTIHVQAKETVLPRTGTPELMWLAAALALLWLVHPIQLTSVLYVVQRMTSLSALFTLLALICYLKGRLLALSEKPFGAWLMVIGPVLFGVLGLLSKETTALLPLYILAIELTLFRTETPWCLWRELPSYTRKVVIVVAITATIAALAAIVVYALPNYALRNFTMVERLLTEARVLLFYLSLVLVPRIDHFGLYHDDIEVSTSLIAPWTTLPSVLIVVALLTVAFLWRKRHPLLSLGLLWFFVAHALESTIISLEIAHEHRNYLATLGVWLAVGYFILLARDRLEFRQLWVLFPVLIATFAAVTTLRSSQWENLYSLAQYEVRHHPRSADALNLYGYALAKQGNYPDAAEAFKEASEISPFDPTFLVNYEIARLEAGEPFDAAQQREVLVRIRNNAFAAAVTMALDNMAACVQTTCRKLQPLALHWSTELLREPPPKTDISFLYYLQGVAFDAGGHPEEALGALWRSYEHDRKYLHPLVEIAKINIARRNTAAAAAALDELRKANHGNKHPRNAEIALLEKELTGLHKNVK
jgi:tetratricopeptide (TPR) repeat protein